MILRLYCQFLGVLILLWFCLLKDPYLLERVAKIFMNAVIALGLASAWWKKGGLEKQCECKKM